MLQPARVHADFEVALKNAIEEVFPDSVLAGCLFHLAQNFIKHLRAAGLMHLYVTDAEFAQSAKMIMCLAFLPISDLEDAFTMLEETLPIELEPILRWFEEYYLGTE